jgi:hypothetical protein
MRKYQHLGHFPYDSALHSLSLNCIGLGTNRGKCSEFPI